MLSIECNFESFILWGRFGELWFCFTFVLATDGATVPNDILEKIVQQLREKKPQEELEDPTADNRVQEFQIWDFAGQDVYYTTHQVRYVKFHFPWTIK